MNRNIEKGFLFAIGLLVGIFVLELGLAVHKSHQVAMEVILVALVVTAAIAVITFVYGQLSFPESEAKLRLSDISFGFLVSVIAFLISRYLQMRSS